MKKSQPTDLMKVMNIIFLKAPKIHPMVLYLSVYLMISYQVIQAIKSLMMNTIGINSVMLIQKRNAMFFFKQQIIVILKKLMILL